MGRKGRKKATTVLTPGEVDAIIGAASRRAPTGIRNRALVGLMAATGLRNAEALELLPRDINFDERTVHVRRGKGGKERWVGLQNGAAALVQRWLDVRAKLLKEKRVAVGRAPLFCTLDGGPMSTAYCRAMVLRLAARAGVEQAISPHDFRHHFAVEMLKAGASLADIQKALGHSRPTITDRYLSRICPLDAIRAVRSLDFLAEVRV